MEESENFKPADESSNSKGEEDSRQVQLSIRTSAQQTEFGDSHLARLDREGLYEDPHATNLRGHASQALNAKGTGRTSTPARGPTTPSPEETPDRLTDQYGEVQTVPLAPSSLGEVRSQVLAPPSESDRRHGRPSVNARLQMFVARRCNEMSGRKIFFARFLMRCLRRRMYGKTRNWHLEAQRRSGHRPRDVESLELRHRAWLQATLKRMKFETLALRQWCVDQIPHGHNGDELDRYFGWLQVLSTCGGDIRQCQKHFQDEDDYFDEDQDESDWMAENSARQATEASGVDTDAAEEALYAEEDIESSDA